MHVGGSDMEYTVFDADAGGDGDGGSHWCSLPHSEGEKFEESIIVKEARAQGNAPNEQELRSVVALQVP